MTAKELRSRLHALGLTAEDFARLTGLHADTVRNWGKPRSGRDVQQVPLWVPLLLSAWEIVGAPDRPTLALVEPAGGQRSQPRTGRGSELPAIGAAGGA